VKKQKEIRNCRVNLVVTETVGKYVTECCNQQGISESQWWRAAGNKFIIYLATQGTSAIYPYFKDVTEDDIRDLEEQVKKVVDLSRRRHGTFSDGALFGITEESIEFFYLACKAAYLSSRYIASLVRKECYSCATTVPGPKAGAAA